MTKKARIILGSLVLATVLGGLSYLAFHSLTQLMYKQRTCEWANIDNIELHANVDIPEIKECGCEYKKEQNIKLAYFDIDKENVDLDKYIRKNNFIELKSKTEITMDEFLQSKISLKELSSSSSIYYTKGSLKGETWQTVLDIASGRLWVTIRYKD